MKIRFFFQMLVLCLPSLGWTQSNFNDLSDTQIKQIKKIRHPLSAVDIQAQNWYIPSEAIEYFGGNTGTYRYQFIFPDTNALFVIPYTGGPQAVAIKQTSLGYVFDPRSALFTPHPTGPLTNWNGYTVDSIWFYYVYNRFNTDTSLVDTLELSFFDNTAMLKGFENDYAAAVNYSYLTNEPYGKNVLNHTIYLTHKHANSTGTGLVVPLHMPVSANALGYNWFGTALQFKPAYTGYKNSLQTDTLANFATMETGAKFSNVFRLFCFNDISKYFESMPPPPLSDFGNRILNHGIVATQIQKYRLPGLGGLVNDYYYPTFYPSHNLVPVIDIHLHVANLHTNHLPVTNPLTQTATTIHFGQYVQYTLYNLSGKQISSGKGTELNTQPFASGIYCLQYSTSGKPNICKIVIP